MTPDRIPIYAQVAEYLDTAARDLMADRTSPRLLAATLDGVIHRLAFWSETLHTLTDMTPQVVKTAHQRARAKLSRRVTVKRQPPTGHGHRN